MNVRLTSVARSVAFLDVMLAVYPRTQQECNGRTAYDERLEVRLMSTRSTRTTEDAPCPSLREELRLRAPTWEADP